MLELLKKLWVLPADIKLSAHNNKLRSGPHTYSYIGNVPFIDLADKPIAEWDHVEVGFRQGHGDDCRNPAGAGRSTMASIAS